MLIRGADSHASDPERDGRALAFHHRHVVTIPNAGHWVHHDQLEAFLRAVELFLKDEPPGA
jgi:pimeloyl-ACP methyl ester carboxylesterase